MERFTIVGMEQNESVRKNVVRLLKLADLGVSEVVIEKEPLDMEFAQSLFKEEFLSQLSETEMASISMWHSTQDSERRALIPLDQESCGTRRFFVLLGPWLYSLSTGGLLVVDEIDSSLHPFLVRELVKLFHSPSANVGNGQLVFNTHDTSQLDHTLFRRDQIWFAEKDRNGESHLYPLLDYKPRKGEALEKGYLEGRYGAIPFFGDLKGFDINAEE